MSFLKSIIRNLLRDEIEDLEDQIASKEYHINSLNKSIQEKDSEIASSTFRLEKVKFELHQQNNQLEELRNILKTKERQIRNLESDLALQGDSLTNTISQLKNVLEETDERMRTNEANLGANIRMLNEQLEASQQKLYIKSRESLNLEERLDEANCEIIKRDAKIQILEDTKKGLEFSLQQSVEKVEKCNDEIIVIKSKCNEVLSEFDEFKSIQEAQNTKLRENYEEELKKKSSLIDQLETELENLKSNQINNVLLKSLQNQLNEKKNEISRLESDIQRLNENLSESNNKKLELENELDELKVHNGCLEQRLQDIRSKLNSDKTCQQEIANLKAQIQELLKKLENSPKPSELEKRDKEIEKLKRELQHTKLTFSQKDQSGDSILVPKNGISTVRTLPDGLPPRRKTPTRALAYPYQTSRRINADPQNIKDFPKIENDNKYAPALRMINEVYNARTNDTIKSSEILLGYSAEEISKLRFDLEEAVRKNTDYLLCPCCRGKLIIKSRKNNWIKGNKEIQYFSHALKNIPCALKKVPQYTSVSTGYPDDSINNELVKEMQSLIKCALTSEISKSKGISSVETNTFIHSDELPIMRRRLADVIAKYGDNDVVFELVSPKTNIKRVHDRDVFYLINNRQVFWLFGLDSVVNYDELRRSVAKDILFTNKRNVFVFDVEAQNETRNRGELMLKCNWLDENDEWYYNIQKNGKNGILVSLDQISFNSEECRPYFYDADEPYYLKNPSKYRPAKISREDLRKEINESYEFELARTRALNEMNEQGCGVTAYFDGEKWGFKYNDLVLVSPKYTSEPVIVGDFAKVELGEKFGVINRFGEIVLDVRYDNVEILKNGHILYTDSGKWRLFGTLESLTPYYQNDMVEIKTLSSTSSIYYVQILRNLYANQVPEEIYFINDIIVKKNIDSEKWILWPKKDGVLTDVAWDSFEITNDDKIKVSQNGRKQLFGLDGEILEDDKYRSKVSLADNYILVEMFDGYWNIVDLNDNLLLQSLYKSIEKIDDRYLKYCLGNKWGVMNYRGELITDALYNSIGEIVDDQIIVTIEHPRRSYEILTGKISTNGKNVYTDVERLANGRKIVSSFGLCGIADDEMNIIIALRYDTISLWDNNRYRVVVDGKYGIIDEQGSILLPFEYSYISDLQDGVADVKRGIRTYKIDKFFKQVEDEIIPLQEGYKKIKFSGKWGILAPDGTQIVNCQYDEITTFRGRLVGIINKSIIKLNALYPYRLAMRGNVLSSGQIDVGGVKFKLQKSKKNITQKTKQIDVFLVNWTSSYKIVMNVEMIKSLKRAKHIDQDSDFILGSTYEAKVSSILKKKNKKNKNQKYMSKFKGVDVCLDNQQISHIYKSDFVKAGINGDNVSIGDAFKITKLGYDEELDRTIWNVEMV